MTYIIQGFKNISFIIKSFLIVILVIMPDVLLAQEDISIRDFRIPETKFQRLTGSLSGGWNRTDHNYTDYSFGALQDHYSSLSKYSNYKTALAYNFASFNESNSLEIGAQLSGGLTYQSGNGSYSYAAPYYESSQLQEYYSVSISPDIRYSNYLVPDTWFWFTEGSGEYSYTQNMENFNVYFSDGSDFFDSTYTKNCYLNAVIGGGVGYGKLRDGSSVFAVLRILDKLVEDSMLVRTLTKDEVLRIVDIFERKVEFVYSQEKYTKFFMEDIFILLQEMDVLRDNYVTAYSVLRAVEVISEQIEPRLFGWRARISIQRKFTEEIDARDLSGSGSYTSDYLWYFRDYFSFSFDCGYPVTLNLQVNSNFSLNVPRIDYQRKIDYRFQITGIYQIGERIDAAISGSIIRSTLPYQSASENEFLRYIRYNTGISFRFFIENNVSFNTSCSYSEQYRDRYSLFNSGNSNYRFPTIEFGLTYRFL